MQVVVYALLADDHSSELAAFRCHDADPVAEVSNEEIDSFANGSPQDVQEQASADEASVLQEQLASALQRVAVAEKEAAAAKEAAGTELALMRRQLTSSQAGLAEAEQVCKAWPVSRLMSQPVECLLQARAWLEEAVLHVILSLFASLSVCSS